MSFLQNLSLGFRYSDKLDPLLLKRDSGLFHSPSKAVAGEIVQAFAY